MSESWQLVAHPESDICDVAVLSVHRAFRQRKEIAKVVSVANIAEARESLEAHGSSDLDLVLIASTMPADDSSSMGFSSRDATKQFIKQLKSTYPALPVVVVASTPDEPLADFLDAFDNTGLVTLGTDFGPSLVQRIGTIRASTDVGGRKPQGERGDDSWIHLDIHLPGGKENGDWQIYRVGCVEFKANGTLQVDKRQLARFISESKRLDEGVARNDEKWLDHLKDLSDDLRDLLFRNGPDNMDFWDKFLMHRERVGGIARSRIRVTVDEVTHSMLFEALRDSDADEAFWVLKAPVFRRYAQQMAFPPLFKERDEASRAKPKNCLIIEADPEPGVVVGPSGHDETFSRLPYLQHEADTVEEVLRQHAGGTVERLSLGLIDEDLPAYVLAKLAERQWHVVHFCGHVCGDADNAALVLSADAAGLLPIKPLARALARSQLLFLSSCRSASTRIVMHAVERHVSAVVGFQWVIDDRAASEFAIDFYRQLFSSTDAHARDLEYALLEARRKVHQRQPELPSWVAPVLVMQMG